MSRRIQNLYRLKSVTQDFVEMEEAYAELMATRKGVKPVPGAVWFPASRQQPIRSVTEVIPPWEKE
jgi:hypothetical protein